MQPSLSPNTNAATARMLERLGKQVLMALANVRCCGAVAYHQDAQGTRPTDLLYVRWEDSEYIHSSCFDWCWCDTADHWLLPNLVGVLRAHRGRKGSRAGAMYYDCDACVAAAA